MTLLTDWQRQHPSNRRETLARILLKIGCYKAAIKLDAKSKHAFAIPLSKPTYAIKSFFFQTALLRANGQWLMKATKVQTLGELRMRDTAN